MITARLTKDAGWLEIELAIGVNWIKWQMTRNEALSLRDAITRELEPVVHEPIEDA